MKRNSVRLLVVAALVMMLSGCEEKQFAIETPPTPTPVPTATPTPKPTPTPTPIPTPTPALRIIGFKEEGARYIVLANNLNEGIRQIYIRNSVDYLWSNNLVPAESLLRASEKVRMYYEPIKDDPYARFDIRMITKDGETYEFYSVNLDDMDNVRLHEGEYGGVKMTYISLANKSETSTDTAWGYNEEYYEYDPDDDSDYNYDYDYDDEDYDYSYDYEEDYDYDYDYDDDYYDDDDY